MCVCLRFPPDVSAMRNLQLKFMDRDETKWHLGFLTWVVPGWSIVFGAGGWKLFQRGVSSGTWTIH